MALAEDPGHPDDGVGERGLREQILDAAHACVIRYGVPKTTIEDVIKAAGVSRATLYKYVPGGRDELIVEVLVREGRRNIDVVLDAMRGEATLEDRLAAGILAAAERIGDDDHLRYLFSPEIVDPRTGLHGAAIAMIDATTEIVGPILDRGTRGRPRGGRRHRRGRLRMVMRMILSLLTFSGPTGRSHEELLEFVRRYAVHPLLHP